MPNLGHPDGPDVLAVAGGPVAAAPDPGQDAAQPLFIRDILNLKKIKTLIKISAAHPRSRCRGRWRVWAGAGRPTAGRRRSSHPHSLGPDVNGVIKHSFVQHYGLVLVELWCMTTTFTDGSLWPKRRPPPSSRTLPQPRLWARPTELQVQLS